jgi:hypothetical protein
MGWKLVAAPAEGAGAAAAAAAGRGDADMTDEEALEMIAVVEDGSVSGRHRV